MQVITEAARHFRNIKTLALPTCALSPRDYLVMRSCSSLNSSATVSPGQISGNAATFALGHIAKSQQEVFQTAASNEASVIVYLGTNFPNLRNLQSISFVRPETATSGMDSAIEYRIRILPGNQLGMASSSEPASVVRVDLLSQRVHPAWAFQHDALPRFHAHQSSMRVKLQEMQKAAIVYARENQVASVVAAGAGGILLSEAGRAIYAHAMRT